MGLHEFTIISYLFFQLGYSKRREEIQRGIEIDVDGSSWHFLPADWETAGTSNRNSRYRGYRGFARQPRCIAGTIKIFCKRKRKKNLLFLPYNMAAVQNFYYVEIGKNFLRPPCTCNCIGSFNETSLYVAYLWTTLTFLQLSALSSQYACMNDFVTSIYVF